MPTNGRTWLSPFVSDSSEAPEGEHEWRSEDEARAPRQVRARILWPALGFPAVIAPRTRAADVTDATRSICVLFLADVKDLTKAEIARYLRCVPWDQRARRHIAVGEPGSFKEEELSLKNDLLGGTQALRVPAAPDRLSTLVRFGADHEGDGGVTVTLANTVIQFYKSQGLGYLYEVRVYEWRCGQIADGRYQLFWNNAVAKENAPSDEMALLLRAFAPTRREGLGALWRDQRTHLLEEYEYEYGHFHQPYAPPNAKASAGPRAEVLHPLFVKRDLPSSLAIGHLTDIHVDVRADVYEHNLTRKNIGAKYRSWTSGSYNNWNRNFAKAYADARPLSNILLLTGDLVDYGRGHWGVDKADTLGQNGMYHLDRNWFLFYWLLASGDNYCKPAYTILGNHDWRVNPYPPFAPGGPNPRHFIHNHRSFTEDQRKDILKIAHGPGHDLAYSYELEAKGLWSLLLSKNFLTALNQLQRLIRGKQTMDETGTPAHTTVKSVEWYLLSINPFFDYSFTLPSGHDVLMLDWAEDENVLFPIIDQGKEYPYIAYLLRRDDWSDPGPKAKSSLTKIQRWMLEQFTGHPGKARIIGIHAPPVGPYSDWRDPDLWRGRKTYKSKAESRGPMDYATKRPDGKEERWNGHPFFAVRPSDAGLGVEADYGSFERERDAFFKSVIADASKVRLVFSGHIHRAGLLVIDVPKSGGKPVEGKMRVYGLTDALVRNAKPPAVSPAKVGAHGPLFVNTTSLGPRGHFYPGEGPDQTAAPGYALAELGIDGTIKYVKWKWPIVPAEQKPLPVAVPPKKKTEVGELVG